MADRTEHYVCFEYEDDKCHSNGKRAIKTVSLTQRHDCCAHTHTHTSAGSGWMVFATVQSINHVIFNEADAHVQQQIYSQMYKIIGVFDAVQNDPCVTSQYRESDPSALLWLSRLCDVTHGRFRSNTPHMRALQLWDDTSEELLLLLVVVVWPRLMYRFSSFICREKTRRVSCQCYTRSQVHCWKHYSGITKTGQSFSILEITLQEIQKSIFKKFYFF